MTYFLRNNMGAKIVRRALINHAKAYSSPHNGLWGWENKSQTLDKGNLTTMRARKGNKSGRATNAIADKGSSSQKMRHVKQHYAH